MIGPDLEAIVAAGPEAIAHYDAACRAFARREYEAVERDRSTRDLTTTNPQGPLP